MYRLLGLLGHDRNDIIEGQQLSKYYAPLFKPNERTDEFLMALAEVFGNRSRICGDYPRPFMCTLCFDKYIGHLQLIINHLTDTQTDGQLLDLYQHRILPRFEDLREQGIMVKEHMRASHEHVDNDTILGFMGIDMSVYDPPSKEIMNQCSDYKYTVAHESETCAICLCDMEEGDNVKKLVCRHVFHDACVMGWLNTNSTCPMCKASLKTDNTEKHIEPYHFLDTLLPPSEEVSNSENEHDGEHYLHQVDQGAEGIDVLLQQIGRDMIRIINRNDDNNQNNNQQLNQNISDMFGQLFGALHRVEFQIVDHDQHDVPLDTDDDMPGLEDVGANRGPESEDDHESMDDSKDTVD